MGVYCTEILSRNNLTFDVVIHPTCPKHQNWMARLQTELGGAGQQQPPVQGSGVQASAASASTAAAGTSQADKNFCQYCSIFGASKRCSSCKEVLYCSKDHQKLAWRRHKACCKAIEANHVLFGFRLRKDKEVASVINKRTTYFWTRLMAWPLYGSALVGLRWWVRLFVLHSANWQAGCRNILQRTIQRHRYFHSWTTASQW